ncbi:MAG: M23 family metallopeptidase [Planctomycetes bacterium]|nr:M23 family metallopeptidase [Planctomycetota bacterium]
MWLRLPTLTVCLLLGACAGQATAPPSPVLEVAEYSCPIEGGGTIYRGNGEAPSHVDRYNYYAWDWAAEVGTPVVAAREGTVVSSIAHWVLGGSTRAWIPFGNEVKIQHEDGTVGVYLHLQRQDDPPRVGDQVLRGERIGFVGLTGWTEGPHLHFTIHRNGVSAPAAFKDFPRRNGNPRTGDRHDAPAPPATPQTIIDRCKKTRRALERTAGLAIDALALRLLEDGLGAAPYPGYPPWAALDAQRAALRDRLAAQVADWSAREVFEREEALEAQGTRGLLREVLRSDRDLLAAAYRAGRRGPAKDRGELTASQRLAVSFADGLVAFAYGDDETLMRHWKPLATRPAAWRDRRDQVLARVFDDLASTARAAIERYRRQTEMATPKDHDILHEERRRIESATEAVLGPMIRDYPDLRERAKFLQAEVSRLRRPEKAPR